MLCLQGLWVNLPARAATLSLEEAVAYAVVHSPDLNTASRQADISDLQRKIVRTQFLPSVDFGSSHGFTHATPSPSATDPWLSQVTLTAKENLYDNGISILQYDQAKINKDYADLNRDRTLAQLHLNVALDFYAYSLAKQNRDIQAEQLKNLEKQFLSVSDMYQQGFKTRADYLRLKTQVQRARISLNDAENQVATSVVELKRILAVPPEQGDEISFQSLEADHLNIEVPGKKPDPEKTYDYRLASIQAQSTKVNISIARRVFYPNVNVSAGANYGYANYINSNGTVGAQTGWSALLNVSFNLMDWGLRRYEVDVAQKQQLIQENQMSQAKLSSQAMLETIRLNFIQMQNDYTISKELLGLEKENYAMIRRNYQEGKVQYLDLITSLGNFFSAQQSFITAAYGLAQNLAKYHFYEGTLYATSTER